jgi:hypothetical protein
MPAMSHYRGYRICISAEDSLWSTRTEPITPDHPILSQPVSDGHQSRVAALRSAKREIDRLQGLSEPAWFPTENE